MIIIKETISDRAQYLYLSKQRGALITIIICNIIALMTSTQSHLLQIFTLLFGISIFHVAEYFTLTKREKTKLRIGFSCYAITTLITAYVILTQHEHLMVIATMAIPFAFLFVITQKYGKKTPLPHLSSFALLILVGLLTHHAKESLSTIHLFSQLFIYFSCSVLLINWKIKKISLTWLTVFTLLATFVLFIFHAPTVSIYLLLTIINVKLLITLLFSTRILKVKMKTIGYLETMTCILLIYIL